LKHPTEHLKLARDVPRNVRRNCLGVRQNRRQEIFTRGFCVCAGGAW